MRGQNDVTSGSPTRFLRGFVLGAIVALMPLVAFTGRLIALGEVGLPATSMTGSASLLHLRSYDLDEAYKLRETVVHAPDLLVLGSSRALSTRSFFFDRCTRVNCFYNAGLGMRTIREGQEFLAVLARGGNLPRVLVVNVDQWQLNPNYQVQEAHRAPDLTPGPITTSGLLFVKNLVTRLRDDPDFRSLIIGQWSEAPQTEGIEARMHGQGFRQDGSYFWGASHAAAARSDRDLLNGTIRQGSSRFPPFDRSDEQSVDELDKLLTIAQEHGVAVIGYSAPYGDDIWASIVASSASGYEDAEARIRSTFSAHGFPFVAFHRLSDVGCADDEMWDGLHVTEVCDARIYRELLRMPSFSSTLSPYVSAEWLDGLIANARSSFFLRDDQ